MAYETNLGSAFPDDENDLIIVRSKSPALVTCDVINQLKAVGGLAVLVICIGDEVEIVKGVKRGAHLIVKLQEDK